MPTAQRPIDPLGNFRFRIEINGRRYGMFQEVSGLESAIEVIEHGEGGWGTAMKIPGLVKYTNLVLKWGLIPDLGLYNWHADCVAGGRGFQRRSGAIIGLDRTGSTDMASWHFSEAWPCRYVGPNFSAEGNDIAVETLELAHEGITRVL